MAVAVEAPAAPSPSTEADVAEESPPTATSGVDPTAEFQGDVEVNNDLPTATDLAKVADLVVLGADGTSRPFKSLYTGHGVPKRVLIIFIRHFFCGNCQEYIRALTKAVTPESLLSLPTPTSVAVIGCGKPDMIPMYAKETACSFPVYADPSRKLYDLLGMTKTLALGPKQPQYMRRSLLQAMVASFFQELSSGTKMLRGGDFRQVGGEFIFDEGKAIWCHRMRNTRDHAEIPKLQQVLGSPTKTEEPAVARRRRSLGVGRVINRMSGDWSRRADPKLSNKPELVNGDKNTKAKAETAIPVTNEPVQTRNNELDPRETKAENGTVPAGATNGAATTGEVAGQSTKPLTNDTESNGIKHESGVAEESNATQHENGVANGAATAKTEETT